MTSNTKQSKEYWKENVVMLESVGSALDTKTQLIHPLFKNGVVEFDVDVKVEKATEEFTSKLNKQDALTFRKHAIMNQCALCVGYIDLLRNAEDEVIWNAGHNAAPLSEGRCCTSCNDLHVVPARLASFTNTTPKYIADCLRQEADMVEQFAKEVDVHSMERMLIRLRKYTDMVKKMKDDIEQEIHHKQ